MLDLSLQRLSQWVLSILGNLAAPGVALKILELLSSVLFLQTDPQDSYG